MKKFAILYDEKLKEYDLGHVLGKDRYQSFVDLFNETLGHQPEFDMISPGYATDEDLKLIHTEEYIRRVERCKSMDPHDTPLSPRFVRATKLLAGAGKLAGELVRSGSYQIAFVVGGGVQHATRDREKGFGVFSDVGLCAENLMKSFGVRRILIIDTDAHAGDGIYEIFSHDRRVLSISIHQNPLTLYPGKGFINEIGGGDAKGYAVNIPLPPGAGDRTYEYVLNETVVPLAEEFDPEIILLVDGSDPHFTDRITQMGMTLEGIRSVGATIRRLASKTCEGRVVDFVGSGYSSNVKIVSLGWLASIAGLTGVHVNLEEPQPIPPGVKPDQGLDETQRTIRLLRGELSGYWRCFG